VRRPSALTSAATVLTGLALMAGSVAALGGAPAAAAPSAVQAKRAVTITVKVSRTEVAVGQRFVIKGKVRPKKAGKRVALQQKRPGGWQVVDRDKLTKKGRYRFVRTATDAERMRFRVVLLRKGSKNTRSKPRVVRALRNGRSTGGSGSGSGSTGLSTREARVLELTNELRARGTTCGSKRYDPAPPLTADARLNRAAQAHSDDMVARDYFDHLSPEGDGPDKRATATGYQWSRVGENIAWGYQTPQAVVDGWEKSEGHCRNLMNPDYRHIGIGSTGSSSPMWVQLFATPR
jgi:uncharacterized protein YkwD